MLDLFLNYGALFVGSLLAVLSTLFETSKTEDGQLKITRTGVIFLALILVALVISVANWHATESENVNLRQQIENIRKDVALEKRIDDVFEQMLGQSEMQNSFSNSLSTNIDQCLAIVDNGCQLGGITDILEVTLEEFGAIVDNMKAYTRALQPDQKE